MATSGFLRNIPYLGKPSENNLREMINESVSLATPFFQSEVPKSLSEIIFSSILVF